MVEEMALNAKRVKLLRGYVIMTKTKIIMAKRRLTKLMMKMKTTSRKVLVITCQVMEKNDKEC